MPYPFDQIFAADPDNTDMVATNAAVVIFAPGDETKTPLKLTTLNGLPLENPIIVNDRGFGPAFIADLDQVAWEGGGFTGLLASYRGLKDDAEAARQEAALSRAAAEEAARNTVAPTAEVVAEALTSEGPAREAFNAAMDTRTDGLALKPDNGARAIGKGELVAYSKDYGLKGDGSDEFERLKGFLEAGGTLVFEQGKTYSYNPVAPVEVREGTTIITNGAKFRELVSYDDYRIRLNSNTKFDSLDISCAGGANLARGVLLRGRGIRGGTLSITLREPNAWHGNYRRRALSIGVEGATDTNANINAIYIEGWEYGAIIWGAAHQPTGAAGVTIGSIGHVSVKQGLVIRDSCNVLVASGYHKTLSPHCKGNPGENAVLVEATTGNHSVRDIQIKNFYSFESGEHGFRLGGQYMMKNITFENCYASGAGKGIGTGIEPDNHGGCGFKVLGPTSITDNRARHSNIRFVNCTVEDLHRSEEQGNYAGFNIGKSYNVTLINPIVRAAPTTGYGEGTYSAYNGIEIIGSEQVEIVSPMISNVLNSGIVFYDDVQTSRVTWGGGCTMVNVQGGVIRNPGNAGFEFANTRETMRNVAIKGSSVENCRYDVLCVDGSSALLNRCSAKFTTKGVIVANTLNCNLMILDIEGDIVGANAARGGSTTVNYGTAVRQLFRGSAWVNL